MNMNKSTSTSASTTKNNNSGSTKKELNQLEEIQRQTQEVQLQVLLDWTSKQGRILTANGQAGSYYTPERGYPYKEEELPHFHLLSNSNSTDNNTHAVFSSWAKERREILKNIHTQVEQGEGKGEGETSGGNDSNSHNNAKRKGKGKFNFNKEKYKYPVCGAWTRPLFVGEWEHTTGSEDEIVFNVQTNTLFIDMRIPRLAKTKLKYNPNNGNGDGDGNANDSKEKCHGHDNDNDNDNNVLCQMDENQLRLYARRHAFAGYTVLDHHFDKDSQQTRIVCTRHHCIDWNFVGIGRNRPNKWYVELLRESDSNGNANGNANGNINGNANIWKEWSFARDQFSQHYYWERWERLENDANGKGLVLALRLRKQNEENSDNGKGKGKGKGDNKDDHRMNATSSDGIIVAVGDHFNYIFPRKMKGTEKTYGKGNLVDTVDAAIEAGDRNTAESYLSIDAGHGTISSGWVIDCALQYWKEGSCLFSGGGNDNGNNNGNDSGNDNDNDNGFSLNKTKSDNSACTVETCKLSWNKNQWEVYECSLDSLEDLDFVLQWRGQEGHDSTSKSSCNHLHQILGGQSSTSIHLNRKRKFGNSE